MEDSRRMRLENFSDAVMAIAITVLSIEIPHSVPAGEGVTNYHALTALLPGILTFLLGFMTFAIFWVNHHQLTQHIHTIRRRVTWSTMLFLFFMTLIPFASRVLLENGKTVFGVMLYAAVLFGGSFMFSVLHFLVHKKEELPFWGKMRSFFGPFLYACAIVCAPWSLVVSYIALIIVPLFYFLPKKHSSNHFSA